MTRITIEVPDEDPAYLAWLMERECPVHGEVQVVGEASEPVPSMLGYGWELSENLSCGCTVHMGPDAS